MAIYVFTCVVLYALYIDICIHTLHSSEGLSGLFFPHRLSTRLLTVCGHAAGLRCFFEPVPSHEIAVGASMIAGNLPRVIGTIRDNFQAIRCLFGATGAY